MKRFKFKDLPNGFILGKVNLVDVKKYWSKESFLKDKKLHLAKGFGKYGFVLEDAERIKPKSVKGMLEAKRF